MGRDHGGRCVGNARRHRGRSVLPDWGGKLWKLDAASGQVIWSMQSPTTTGLPTTSPARVPHLPAAWSTLATTWPETSWRLTRRPPPCAGSRLPTRTLQQYQPDRQSSPMVSYTWVFHHVSRRTTKIKESSVTGSAAPSSRDAQCGGVLWRTYVLPDNAVLQTSSVAPRVLPRLPSTLRPVLSTTRSTRPTPNQTA